MRVHPQAHHEVQEVAESSLHLKMLGLCRNRLLRGVPIVDANRQIGWYL